MPAGLRFISRAKSLCSILDNGDAFARQASRIGRKIAHQSVEMRDQHRADIVFGLEEIEHDLGVDVLAAAFLNVSE